MKFDSKKYRCGNSSDETFLKRGISTFLNKPFLLFLLRLRKEYYENAFRRILPSKEAHKTLINELKISPFIEEQRLGKKLKKLRQMKLC